MNSCRWTAGELTGHEERRVAPAMQSLINYSSSIRRLRANSRLHDVLWSYVSVARGVGPCTWHVLQSVDFWQSYSKNKIKRWMFLGTQCTSTGDKCNCRLTNYELLRWSVEMPSRDFAHYRLSGGCPDMLYNIYNMSPATSWHVDTCHEVRSWHVVNILRKWSHEFDSRSITKSNVIFCTLFFVYILFCFCWFMLLRFS